jgi:hypothetical protein
MHSGQTVDVGGSRNMRWSPTVAAGKCSAFAEFEGHPVPSVRRYCMDAGARWRDDAHMPLDLTDAELATAVQACRALAFQEGERAKKMENPSMRGPIENAAKRYAALAAKFVAARKRA